jgi:hypothetical protein
VTANQPVKKALNALTYKEYATTTSPLFKNYCIEAMEQLIYKGEVMTTP